MAPQSLDADTIDDLLYFARTADAEELSNTLKQLSQERAETQHDILIAAKDADSGNTTLHMAAANGHTDIIKLLLSSSSQNANGQAPGVLPVSPALLSIPNSNGNTPLHWAALNGHLDAVKVLVDAGADLLAKNNAGHDVAYEAEIAGKEEVVNWLLSVEKDEEMDVKEEEAEVEGGAATVQNGSGSGSAEAQIPKAIESLFSAGV